MHMSSAHCLPVIRTTPHGQRGPELSFTVTGICYLMEFVARMLNCFISGSCKYAEKTSNTDYLANHLHNNEMEKFNIPATNSIQ